MEAFKFYSGQSFQYFLRRGGAVLTTGGIPFSRQADPWGKHMDIGTPQQLREVFDKWIAKFGVKYYQCEHRPAQETADTELLPELAGARWTPSATGVVVVNSAHEPVPKPPAGNVFPERTPARTVLPLIASRSPDGQLDCVSAVLSQDFVDGSRRIHFTHEGDGHPLDPAAPHFKALLIRLLSLLRNRLMVQDVEAGFACYRQGEEVAIRGEVANHEAAPTRATVLLEVLADDRVVFRHEETRVLSLGRTALQWTWRPERFDTDAYQIRLSLRRDGALVSRGVNGFVVWDEAVIQRGPKVGRQGAFLTINGKPTYITGTNYYESTRGEAMWYRPNVWALITDHRRMQADGVNMIRPHYHHRKWFRDYLMYHTADCPTSTADWRTAVIPCLTSERGASGMPSSTSGTSTASSTTAICLPWCRRRWAIRAAGSAPLKRSTIRNAGRHRRSSFWPLIAATAKPLESPGISSTNPMALRRQRFTSGRGTCRRRFVPTAPTVSCAWAAVRLAPPARWISTARTGV
jgi:hypothetical protein